MSSKRKGIEDFRIRTMRVLLNSMKMVLDYERAVFHSNRAACLMQMKPIDYETVIAEFTMALQVQPRFVRALLRRARAFEAIGKYELAVQDGQVLLGADPNHRDALEIAQRLRTALGPRQEAQQDLQSRPSPAALGSSAIRGALVAGIWPCLPARPITKNGANLPAGSFHSVVSPNNKPDKTQAVLPTENGPETKSQLPKIVLKPSNGSAEEKMKAATDMWEKMEVQRANELKDPDATRKEELLRRRKKHGGATTEGKSSSVGGQGDISVEEAAEQAAVIMRKTWMLQLSALSLQELLRLISRWF